MKTQLFPHNNEAYRKITAELEKSQRTCIVHPTGTGKSFLIAAVSENYKNVLILGPNVYVLNQVKGVLSWRKEGIEYMTYASLMHQDHKPSGYDLICLDEFHRIGAPEWGNAVSELLEVNPQAKVFGTTATNVRYLDGERDMAKELFDGNVASRITIAEAWQRGILPIPRYVSGLFRWDKTVADATEKIKKSRRLTKDEKRERIFRLSNARLNWDLSYGMPAILRKHLDRDARRVIVFCSNIETLEQMRRKVEVWFREAGFVVYSSCIMHSDMTEVEQREQMEQFESDEGEGVKLMFSINMLNEGIHVPKVAAVIMLRTTSSRIIYLQQMGRCLTAANTDNPLVLDMVDNITTTTVVNDIAIEYNNIEREQAEKQHRKPRTFEVIDYTLDVQDLINKLVPKEWVPIPFKERLGRLLAFCEREGHVPGKRDDKEEMKNWVALRDNYGDRQEIKDLVAKYHSEPTVEDKIRWLQRYVKENKRLPTNKECSEYKTYSQLRDKNKKRHDPRVQEIIDTYSIRRKNERLLNEYVEFVRQNNRLPRHTKSNIGTYEFNLADNINRRLKDHHVIKELWLKYKKRKHVMIGREKRMEILREFIEKEKRLPRKAEKTDYKNYTQLRILHKRKSIAEFAEILEKYKRQPKTRQQ